MAERGLNLGQAGAALDSVRTVGVPKPMRRDISVDASRFGCLLYHTMHGSRIHALSFLINKHGIVGARTTQ